MLALAIMFMGLVHAHAALADDDHENEHEDYEDDEYAWDFSNDFIVEDPVVPTVIAEPIIIPNTSTDEIDQLAAENQRLQEALVLAQREQAARDEQIKLLNKELASLQKNNDADHDGTPDNVDAFPGANDQRLADSDNDGVVDAQDIFPGENDYMYQDIDHDGVRDSEDTDTTKDTDIDNDGIDDAFDTHDDRPFMTKVLGFLGFIHG